MRGRPQTHIWLATLCTLVLAACGIPTDDGPTAFVPEDPTAVAEATPTPIPVETQLFPVYLVDNQGRLQEALRSLPTPLTITALVNELIEEPTEQERDLNLVTIVPAETTFFTDPISANGLAELDFAANTSLDTLEGEQLTLALAQLVWTLTGSPSIERVTIRIDGENQVWPTDEGDKDTPLSREDYDEFDPEFVPPTPTPTPEGGVPPSEEESPEDATPSPGSGSDGESSDGG